MTYLYPKDHGKLTMTNKTPNTISNFLSELFLLQPPLVTWLFQMFSSGTSSPLPYPRSKCCRCFLCCIDVKIKLCISCLIVPQNWRWISWNKQLFLNDYKVLYENVVLINILVWYLMMNKKLGIILNGTMITKALLSCINCDFSYHQFIIATPSI